jgi:hypothetical protein
MRKMRSFLKTRGLASSLAIVLIGYPPDDVTRPPVLVELHGLAPREVRSQTFELPTAQVIDVEAVGAQSAARNDKAGWLATLLQREPRAAIVQPWSGNAWILDLATRKVVWELSAAATSGDSGSTREFSGRVPLPAGAYAAYYAAFPDGEYWTDEPGTTHPKQKWHAFGDEPLEQFTLVVRGDGRRLDRNEVQRIESAADASTIVFLRGTSAEQFQQSGFVLTKPTEVEVSAEGEAREDGEFDYGWLINADTRATVWKFSWAESDPAGGAAKNRIAHASRVLPAGRYAAFYATDDSHDPSEWNAQPPYDPDAWGLRVAVRNASDHATVKPFAYDHVPERATFVALTGIGDSASRTRGFTLARAMDVRIYALGEGRNGRMFDYGWITPAGSRTHVWEMRYQDTVPAGGDRKNRLVDTTVRLEPGSYVVHYVTDDSHSAAGWNAAAPADGRHWGITLLGADGTVDRAAITPYNEKTDPSILAQLTEVRNDEEVRKGFTLSRQSDVRIYAVGEGSGRDMDDYGWIEDARTGKRVWEMTYRSTEHAGGAAKNRSFEGTIRLPAGEYVLRYHSDGSHSFGDWNADPPDDPDAWGVTVYK